MAGRHLFFVPFPTSPDEWSATRKLWQKSRWVLGVIGKVHIEGSPKSTKSTIAERSGCNAIER